jgi:hypothetical protein
MRDRMVQNVNVIQGEACFPEHKLLLCVLDMCEEAKKERTFHEQV